MSDRDQFEARAAEKLRLPVEVIQSARNGDRYLHAFDSMNVMQPLNGWWDWWQASREALKAEQGEDGWIACAERIPDESEAVTVCDHGVDVYPAVFIGGEFYEYGDGLIEDAMRMSNPTHWQPLPSPPAINHPIDTTPNQYDALGKGGEQ